VGSGDSNARIVKQRIFFALLPRLIS